MTNHAIADNSDQEAITNNNIPSKGKGNTSLDTGLDLLKGYNLPLDIKGTTALQ